MNLLIHDLAAAYERDAADGYDVIERAYRPDHTRREPNFRFRSGRVDEESNDTPRDEDESH